MTLGPACLAESLALGIDRSPAPEIDRSIAPEIEGSLAPKELGSLVAPDTALGPISDLPLSSPAVPPHASAWALSAWRRGYRRWLAAREARQIEVESEPYALGLFTDLEVWPAELREALPVDGAALGSALVRVWEDQMPAQLYSLLRAAHSILGGEDGQEGCGGEESEAEYREGGAGAAPLRGAHGACSWRLLPPLALADVWCGNNDGGRPCGAASLLAAVVDRGMPDALGQVELLDLSGCCLSLACDDAGEASPEGVCAGSLLCRLVGRMRELVSLRLDGVHVSQALLSAVGAGLPRLALLSLARCGGITDAAIVALCRALPQEAARHTRLASSCKYSGGAGRGAGCFVSTSTCFRR